MFFYSLTYTGPPRVMLKLEGLADVKMYQKTTFDGIIA